MASTPRKDIDVGSTNSQTFFNMMRCILGFGVLTLPKAVAASGLGPVCIASAVIPFLVFKAAGWAVALKEKHFGGLLESAVETESDPLWRAESAAGSGGSYAAANETAPPIVVEDKDAFHACVGGFDVVVGDIFGTFWRVVFFLSIMMTEFGGGVAITSAIEEGLQIIFPDISQNVGLMCICIALLSLTLLASNLREIACLSLASNLVLLYVLISVPIEGIRNSPEGRTMTDRLLLWNTSAGLLDYGYTFGAVAFCYCEFTLLLCIQEDMKHKEDFEWVVGASFSISAVIGVGFAAVGYWAFGAEVKELVYLNFPPGSPMSTICITSYNLILIASYLLFLTPVFLFVKGAFPSVPYSICRCAVIILTTMMSKLLPSVMAVALLLTNMNAQFAGLIIPALCYLRKSDSYNVVQRCTAYLCIVAGSGNMAIGCLSALLSS